MSDQIPQAPPASPCINVCVLNEEGTCVGCLRTIEEISAWGAMSARQRRAVLAELPKRRQNS